MLKFIADLLSSIAQFFSSIADFFVDTFRDLAYVVSLMKEVSPFIGNFLSIFPTVIVTLITATLGIVIIYKFVGREG